MLKRISQIIKSNYHFLLLISLMFVFRSAVADWSDVPTGSMNPTIVEGDRILINKMAYDLRLPFTHISLLKRADPERGDIVIFDSAVSDIRLVKRVIGLPGDRIAMQHNQLQVNGKTLSYQLTTEQALTTEAVEHLTVPAHHISHIVRRNKQRSYYGDFAEVTVPENHYLVLGDNRDNSADSRVIGFVPRDEIVGRSRMVVASLDYDNYFLPRKERFFKTL
ncbi:signal peptidase I [Chromatiaceae bacterium AAb-1]|nr:signal peptidase I [Chromatiaceae bacterium AAb-1]